MRLDGTNEIYSAGSLAEMGRLFVENSIEALSETWPMCTSDNLVDGYADALLLSKAVQDRWCTDVVYGMANDVKGFNSDVISRVHTEALPSTTTDVGFSVTVFVRPVGGIFLGLLVAEVVLVGTSA